MNRIEIEHEEGDRGRGEGERGRGRFLACGLVSLSLVEKSLVGTPLVRKSLG